MILAPIDFEPIKAGQEKLARVFSDEYAFVIPNYQRPYAWEVEHAEALLNDILEALDEALSAPKEAITYFLGSIVLIKQPGAAEAKVVDGQQRLTTLTILLSVLRDLSDQGTAVKRQKFICEEADADTGARSRYRLTLRPRDAEFFRTHIQTVGNTLTIDKVAPDTDSRKCIVDNTAFYRKALSGLPVDRRDHLMAFLLQRCYLVVIAVASVDVAHRVFTVLNARGLDLSPTDILKADLLDRTPSEKESDLSSRWEALEVMLGRDKFVDLFQHMRMVYQQEKPRERLEVGFPKFVKDFASPAAFVKEILEPMGETFYLLRQQTKFASQFGADAGKRLAHLNRLDNSDWISPALLFFSKPGVDKDQALVFMRHLETLAYYLFLKRADINERIARFAQVLKEISVGGWKNGSITLSMQEKQQFKELLNGPIYEMTRVRLPLLLRLDSELSGGGATYEYDILSIEHVLPQNPSADSEWRKNFTDEQRLFWTHKLSNLVILTHRKNSSASNWDFETKKKKYFTGKDGVSPFPLTTGVLNTSDWTESVLNERQKDLIEKLVIGWELNK